MACNELARHVPWIDRQYLNADVLAQTVVNCQCMKMNHIWPAELIQTAKVEGRVSRFFHQ
jgi:hypothetical protein